MVKGKKLLALGMVSALLLGGSVNAFAASKSVDCKFVDSNSYTKLVSITKEVKTANASAKITKFYDSSKTPTEKYKKLYVQCGKDGSQADPELCELGATKKLKLNGRNNKKGITLAFYGMGHDPSLDCHVDAKLNADYTE